MAKKKSRKFLDILTAILLVTSLAVFSYSSYSIFSYEIDKRRSDQTHKEIIDVIKPGQRDQATPGSSSSQEDEPEPEPQWLFLPDSYQRLKAINTDLTAFIHFDSGIINEPVVVSADNADYLKVNFYGQWDELGTVFMDYRATADSPNITLYGHYVYGDTSRMFSPLTLLTYFDTFNANDNITLYFENEVRTYQVAYVYRYSMDDGKSIDYGAPNPPEGVFNRTMEYAQSHSLITTDVPLYYGDHYLTLQTCVRNQKRQRLVVVAKETGRYDYESFNALSQ